MKKATCAFLSAVTLAMFGAVAQENQSVNLVQNGDFSKAEDAKDMNGGGTVTALCTTPPFPRILPCGRM